MTVSEKTGPKTYSLAKKFSSMFKHKYFQIKHWWIINFIIVSQKFIGLTRTSFLIAFHLFGKTSYEDKIDLHCLVNGTKKAIRDRG